MSNTSSSTQYPANHSCIGHDPALSTESLRNHLCELFPEPIVIRSQVTKRSNGLFSSRTLANYDSSNSKAGVPGRFVFNGKVCYERDAFIDWLLTKLKPGKKPIRKRNRADVFLSIDRNYTQEREDA